MFPESMRNLILQSFALPNKAYGQLVTQPKESQAPDIRTVHFQYLEGQDIFAVSTNMESRKWKNLKTHPFLSGCFWNEARQIQFTWKAQAELAPYNSPAHQNLLQDMWMRMREEVRLTYLLHANHHTLTINPVPALDLEKRAPQHGGILFRPYEWDIYQFSPQGFRFGDRRIFKKNGASWSENKVSILNSQPL